MRIRNTKPEFWRSERISSVSWDARLVLKGLESYVDDNGVGKDDIALIVTDVFPRDIARDMAPGNPPGTPGTLRRVSEAISELFEAGLIWRYTVDGTKLMYLSWWDDFQYVNKPNAGRFRRPDGTIAYKESVIGESSRESPGNPGEPRVGTGGQGDRGTGGHDDDPFPDEPELDDPGPASVVAVDAPEFIDAPSPARQHPSGAALTVTRQTLGEAGYPKTIINRLAVQVGKLAHEGHPDTLIRESLIEWDRRDGPMKPEYLPTVLGDVVKRSRGTPGNNGKPPHKMRTLAELAERTRAQEQSQLDPVDRKELA